MLSIAIYVCGGYRLVRDEYDNFVDAYKNTVFVFDRPHYRVDEKLFLNLEDVLDEISFDLKELRLDQNGVELVVRPAGAFFYSFISLPGTLIPFQTIFRYEEYRSYQEGRKTRRMYRVMAKGLGYVNTGDLLDAATAVWAEANDFVRKECWMMK